MALWTKVTRGRDILLLIRLFLKMQWSLHFAWWMSPKAQRTLGIQCFHPPIMWLSRWYHPFKSGPRQFHPISKSWAILASKSWQKSSSTSRTSFSLQTLTKLKPQNLGKNAVSKGQPNFNLQTLKFLTKIHLQSFVSFTKILLLSFKFQFQNLDQTSAFSCCLLSFELTNVVNLRCTMP